MTKKKKPRGRPSKLPAVDLGQVETMAGFGLTADQIALLLGVTDRTLRNWAKSPAFGTALDRGRLKADSNITRALYRKAYGFTQMRRNADGTETELHIPGETVAMIFWLKNRQPKQWRERSEHDHSGKVQLDNKLVIEVVETKLPAK